MQLTVSATHDRVRAELGFGRQYGISQANSPTFNNDRRHPKE
jgi:hypothetical protein